MFTLKRSVVAITSSTARSPWLPMWNLCDARAIERHAPLFSMWRPCVRVIPSVYRYHNHACRRGCIGIERYRKNLPLVSATPQYLDLDRYRSLVQHHANNAVLAQAIAEYMVGTQAIVDGRLIDIAPTPAAVGVAEAETVVLGPADQHDRADQGYHWQRSDNEGIDRVFIDIQAFIRGANSQQPRQKGQQRHP